MDELVPKEVITTGGMRHYKMNVNKYAQRPEGKWKCFMISANAMRRIGLLPLTLAQSSVHAASASQVVWAVGGGGECGLVGVVVEGGGSGWGVGEGGRNAGGRVGAPQHDRGKARGWQSTSLTIGDGGGWDNTQSHMLAAIGSVRPVRIITNKQRVGRGGGGGGGRRE